jgi:hypothetical protein
MFTIVILALAVTTQGSPERHVRVSEPKILPIIDSTLGGYLANGILPHPYRYLHVAGGRSRSRHGPTSSLAHSATAEEGNGPALVRVRSENPSIAALIHDATGWSTTFRGLIETIAATDGLVYVEDGKCGHNVRACLVLSVQVAGPFRLLRVLVNSRGKADCDLVASIGHELQHAIEVLRDPHVTDMHSAYSFFEHEGPTGSGRFETEAAIHVGHHVGDEACAQAKRRE